MNKRHKWYNEIIAFAEGKVVQFYWGGQWFDWIETDCPKFAGNLGWRIKPDPVPDVVVEKIVDFDIDEYEVLTRYVEHWEKPNIRLTFDGETGKLKKAEVIDV
jgi:hypothetical protein